MITSNAHCIMIRIQRTAMRYYRPATADNPLFPTLNQAYRVDETAHVKRLCEAIQWPEEQRQRIESSARELVTTVRANRASGTGVDAFMQEYELSSQEGVVLMCLAEALLRIPDQHTVDELIRDKLCSGDWESHLRRSESLFVNASTWGLMLSGKMINPPDGPGIFRKLLQRSGEPLIRQAVRQAMRIMARQFVMGRSIDEALKRAREQEARGYCYSYDMLGEAARTDADAERYRKAYAAAIRATGTEAAGNGSRHSPGVSIKLSALHPRYELAHGEQVMSQLLPRLAKLVKLAASYNIGLTLDAEEADRLDISLAVLESVALDPDLKDWDGLGLAVQAYQKRAYDLLDWLADLARRSDRRLMVRLVKGAYWDTEIKRAQERGLDGYPVFTRKTNTDVSYMACAQKLLEHHRFLYPQFATHNAHTVATILELVGDNTDFEFQRLHGMGEALYEQLIGTDDKRPMCRIYAPVGNHEDLLPYLVRRLLENGANTSFVNRIVDDKAPVEEIIADPVNRVKAMNQIPHPRIPLPTNIYPDRVNSLGIDLSDLANLAALQKEFHKADLPNEQPSDADNKTIKQALTSAREGFPAWDALPVEQRAECLEQMAVLMEGDMARLIALCASEGGKSIGDGVAEVREAVDFCRYYAQRAREDFQPRPLPGPTGENNSWQLRGKGVFVCISPWNFPLAIFVGQVSAALVTGNTVIAKPAEQTPLIARAAVALFHRAGVPENVLQCLTGPGETTGATLVKSSYVSGVAFTGSTATAHAINRSLAARDAAIATLIAETGGLNAMVVDSSALLEQVVVDVLHSGFQSAGQRCSALRLLLVQADVADELIALLSGAMDTLTIGDPADLATDVGPVIDAAALAGLNSHTQAMKGNARLVKQCTLPDRLPEGHYFPPHLYEIGSIQVLKQEVFGPIVHLMRYRAGDLDSVIDAVNQTGYGLTFGIHSRIDSTVQRVAARIRAGNVYINRNMIGAVVGVQPFGGTGLSGTGPKAGGPHYLHRFASEQSISNNTTAAGGNASLMTLGD